MTTWALHGRDPTEVKAATEERLAGEEARLAALNADVAASAELATGMGRILASFERRLEKLEETILPVYQETENLQRRRENIDRTLEALDGVIAFYNVSKEVEEVVRGGPDAPGVSLDHFLHSLSRLKGALDYFERNNPQSIELENVRTLYEMGGDALSREFSETVKKFGRPVPPVDVLNAIAGGEDSSPSSSASGGSGKKKHRERKIDVPDDDYTSIQHFPEEVQTNLIAMAEWLNLNDRDEFMNVYANVRGQVMKKSLDQFKDYRKSGSGTSGKVSPLTSRKFSSPIVVGGDPAAAGPGTPSGKKVSRISSSLNRKFSTLSTRVETATGLSVGRRSLGTPSSSSATIAEESTEWEVDVFCLEVSALQKLMASEQVAMVGIIPHQYQRRTLEIVVRDSLESLVSDGDAIIARVRRAVAQNDFLAILTVFHVVRYLMQVKPRMDRTLEGCDASVRSKYNTLVHQFFVTGQMALDGFVEGIRGDATTREKMPKDGTVFQLTSNVILFLEQLLEYAETVALVLQQDASYNQTLLRLPRKISVGERPHALVGLYIKKVLIQLNLTLVNKSDTYQDPFLKAVFRLNNNQYILQSLLRNGIMEVISLAEPQCEDNYGDMIMEQKRLYSQSWGRVLSYIWSDDIPQAILQAPGRLSDKHCRVIKEKFAGFNKEMEDIALTQRSYSIPDVELRESLRRDNKEYILPKYSAFYDKYVNVEFSKHQEKYIKYTPAQVSALIDCFFDAAA